MESKVTTGFLLSSGFVDIVGLDQGHASMLENEIHNHGSATGQSSSSTRVEIVCRPGTHKEQLEMSVRVDAAWNDQFSFRLDSLGTTWYDQILPNVPTNPSLDRFQIHEVSGF